MSNQNQRADASTICSAARWPSLWGRRIAAGRRRVRRQHGRL